MSFAVGSIVSYTSIRDILISVALCLLVCVVGSRLFIHPLKSFPGPRLASVTDLYAAYYELWKDGDLVNHLDELHRVYGPIVRIRPNELHFNTPEAYFAIYPPRNGFIKDRKFYSSFGITDSTLGFIDVKEHKKRRDLINPLFSRRAILKFERNIQDNIDLFVQRLQEYKDKPVNFKNGFRALTMDVITTYSYGYALGGLSAPGFDHSIPRSLNSAVVLVAFARYLPWLRAIQWLPPDIGAMLKPSQAGYANLSNSIRKSVETYLADPESFRKGEQETIYHHLLPETVDPSQWPSKASLVDEAMVLISAGTDTTANALSQGFYNLLSDGNEDVLKRLEDELKMAWPEKDSPFSFEQAEKLPYLTGVVKESLRLSTGISLPLARVVVNPTTIDGVYVPAGTVVGVSAKFLLLNPNVFPQPNQFIPERWIQSNSAELDKHLVVFSRGPRTCLGMNLAWCEIYLAISHLVRKFDIKLYETSARDMETRDYVLPSWKGRGLRVLVKERNE